MYVESKVPKDLNKYKTKLGGGSFTLRQMTCAAIAVAVDIALWSLLLLNIDISFNIKVYITMFIDIPIMLFVFEPEGIKMEQYLKNVLLKNFLYPRYRYNKTQETQEYVIDEKRMKERQKEIPKLISEHPELKAYR